MLGLFSIRRIPTIGALPYCVGDAKTDNGQDANSGQPAFIFINQA